MIEWIPINDWVRYSPKPFLILTANINKRESVYVVDHEQLLKSYSPYILFYGEQITHAAQLNLPKEKTLEEKFEDYFSSHGGMLTRNIKELAAIAKQHYEESLK